LQKRNKLRNGADVIYYSITYSSKAKHKRVVIAPSGVRVVLPLGSSREEANELMETVKRRVYRARDRILKQETTLKGLTEPAYVSGSKVPFLGNELQLTIMYESRKRSRLEYNGGLIVRVEAGLAPKAVKDEVRRKVESWIKKQLLEEALIVVQIFGRRMGTLPKGIKIKAQKKIWGSCGRNRIINLNWKLGLFPRKVFEYVVVHELCHLQHMNHSQQFWTLVGSIMPDYKKCGDWLKFRGYGNL
jgi:hypothetical protein